MDHRIFKVPVLGYLFRLAKAIPIAPKAEDPIAYEKALSAAAAVLQEGDLLGIFPEGGITKDGQLQPFKGGIMKVLEQVPAPVIPMALGNLWGSYFSRIDNGNAMTQPLRRGIFNTVHLEVGAPLDPQLVQPESLRGEIGSLLAAAQ
jgi:1-acyl-sn-glycerol-3-phosphate acyltransferase